MSSFTSRNQKSIMEQYRTAATTGTGRRQRTPVASVPIRKKSVPSRTDHGQDKNWRLERRASSKQSPSSRKKPIVDFGHREIGGRMSALERAGIKPTVPSARKSNTTTRKTNSSLPTRQAQMGNNMFSKVPVSPASKDTTILRRSSSSKRLQIMIDTTGQMETCKNLGGGWVQRTDPKQIGSFKQAGTHTIVECRGGKFFICTREPSLQYDVEDMSVLNNALKSGQFDFEIAVKPCIIPNTDRTHQRVHVLIGYKNPYHFLCLTQDVDQHMWRIDMFREQDQGQATLLMNVEDKMLRANRFSKILVQCRGNVLAVSVGGRTLVQGLILKDPSSLCGAVGVATMRSKMIFKDPLISSIHRNQNSNINRSGSYQSLDPRGGGGGGGKKEERTVRSGSLMLPERMMNGAKNAGLGSMDGGVYGHMRSLHGMKLEESRGGGESRKKVVQSSGYGQQHRQEQYQQQQQEQQSRRQEEIGMGGESRLLLAEGGRPPFVGDDRYLIDMIEKDIIHRELGVMFDDVAGLETAKRLLNEAVSLPLLVPEFFTGIREPWKGVLLYGPPGTGKTMLAKAAAGVNNITFFNSSAATMVNKYRGESEKLTRCLFRMARHYSPAIIFIDEIDALARQRGAGQEHEADRRLKSLLFSEMDGIHSGQSGHEQRDGPPRVVVLATTNVPWDLDEAMRRRLEKRIYVPLPDMQGRSALLSLCLSDVETTMNDAACANVVKATEGFSCADVKLLCREAAMMPMRKMLGQASPMEIMRLRKEGKLKAPPPVSQEDFIEALTRTKSSVQKDGQMKKYEQWSEKFGST